MAVALTFDTEFPARPTSAGTEEAILGALSGAEAPATFFLQGRWVRAYPEQARRIVAAGHLVGNHSNYHAPVDWFGDDRLAEDVGAAEETIRTATGVDPKPWFRCPFGSGMDDPRVLAVLERLGYRHVGWDVDPRDWEEGRNAEQLESLVLEGIRARDGDSIVLLHGWPAATAEMLPRLLDRLREDGVELVTVAAL
jgi:peptidoglycan/xylan/chitin deacetylase (PgdA/CDA1 family)